MDLLEALQKASGMDRLLDGRIFERVSGVSAYRKTLPYRDGTASGSRMINGLPSYTDSSDAAVSTIPKDWWLCHAGEDRKPIRYVGDKHVSLGTFTVQLQHTDGGHLQEARAVTLSLAICIAAEMARRVVI